MYVCMYIFIYTASIDIIMFTKWQYKRDSSEDHELFLLIINLYGDLSTYCYSSISSC